MLSVVQQGGCDFQEWFDSATDQTRNQGDKPHRKAWCPRLVRGRLQTQLRKYVFSSAHAQCEKEKLFLAVIYEW